MKSLQLRLGVGLFIRVENAGMGPGGKMPPYTAGKIPAATWW